MTTKPKGGFRMNQETYTYPVIITPCEGDLASYILTVPDFPILMIFGHHIEELIKKGEIQLKKDAVLWYRNCNSLPTPSSLDTLDRYPNDLVVLMTINLTEIMKEEDNKKVRKHILIPSWLNRLAINKNLNFTDVLITALENEVGNMTTPKTRAKRTKPVAE